MAIADNSGRHVVDCCLFLHFALLIRVYFLCRRIVFFPSTLLIRSNPPVHHQHTSYVNINAAHVEKASTLNIN